MRSEYSDAEKEHFRASAISYRIAYRERNKAGGRRGWNLRIETWFRKTPERWAWLNSPNLRTRENLDGAECSACLRWFKRSPDDECFYCTTHGVPEYPNRMRYEALRQRVSMRSVCRGAGIEWRTFRLCYQGARSPHHSTKLKILDALGLPESKKDYLFPVNRKLMDYENPVLVKRQASSLKALDAFFEKHGRMPEGVIGSSKSEHKLCKFLAALRGGKQKLYSDNLNLKLKSLPKDWIIKGDKNCNFVRRQLEMLKAADAFAVKHGRIPSESSHHKVEATLGKWVLGMQRTGRLFSECKKYEVKGLPKRWWHLRRRKTKK